MRTRDDKKQEALFNATVKLVNEIGFASASVSKIASEAGVSPATLYIYFKNKEDLLVSTYVEIKKEMGEAIQEGFDPDHSLYDSLYLIWKNSFSFISANTEEFRYAEQFSNSPYTDLIQQEEVMENFAPIMKMISEGIRQKILKDVNLDLIAAFLFHPVAILANPGKCKNFEADDSQIDQAFEMAWDALRR